MLPAPAQGAVGMTCRADDAATAGAARGDRRRARPTPRSGSNAASSPRSAPTATARSPRWRRVEGDRVEFRAEILAPDGSERVTGSGAFAADAALAGVAAVATDLLARASPELRALFAA